MKTSAFEKTYAGRCVLRCPALELPEGRVTALIGAPFFAYVYFIRRRGERRA